MITGSLIRRLPIQGQLCTDSSSIQFLHILALWNSCCIGELHFILYQLAIIWFYFSQRELFWVGHPIWSLYLPMDCPSILYNISQAFRIIYQPSTLCPTEFFSCTRIYFSLYWTVIRSLGVQLPIFCWPGFIKLLRQFIDSGQSAPTRFLCPMADVFNQFKGQCRKHFFILKMPRVDIRWLFCLYIFCLQIVTRSLKCWESLKQICFSLIDEYFCDTDPSSVV